MSDDRRPGPRLVDVLAIIVLLAVVAGLILLAIPGSPPPRRAHCMRNMHDCAQAVIQYSTYKEHLPASRSRYADLDATLNWVVPILPYLDHDVLLRDIRTGTLPTEPTELSVLQCPGTSTETDFPLSYAVNGGRKNAPDNFDWNENGVFVDRGVFPHPRGAKYRMRMHDIYDGMSNTIMMCENVNLQSWLLAPNEQHSQVLWYPENPETTPNFIGLNQDIDIARTTLDRNTRYARPASVHPGGFMVAMCDGSVRFMAEDISYRVYAVLMTSRGERANSPTNTEYTGADPPWQDPDDPGYPGTDW
jgi:prepilin-type processing-associated H-X9-DG protein